MPLIHIDLTAGKATETQKAALIARVTDIVVDVLGPEQRPLTIVTLIETPPGNRGIGGKVYRPSHALT
jgi:4-oxalocrotonate tautomerase family enzyme